jgi:hypothetical protein
LNDRGDRAAKRYRTVSAADGGGPNLREPPVEFTIDSSLTRDHCRRGLLGAPPCYRIVLRESSVLFDRACTLLQRLGADRRGFSAVLTALALTMLMGVVGLAIDVGMWQWTQRDMQEAADHAAFAAAQSDVQLNPGFGGSLTSGTPVGTNTSIQTGFSVAVAGLGLNPATFVSTGPPPQAPSTGQCYSSQLAAQQGYSAANNTIQICVIYGQATGQNNDYAWQVTITQPRPMWFSKILFSTPGTISASAIAVPKSDNPRSCVIAFNPTQSTIGFAIDGTNGTANVTLTNCDTLVSSSDTDALVTNSTANFSARAIYVGGTELNNGLTFSPGPGAAQNYQNLTQVSAAFLSLPSNPTGGDPYQTMAAPTYRGAPAGTPPGTPSPTGGYYGNGCDYYTGDYTPTGTPGSQDGIHVNLPPENDPTLAADLASRKYDGPGVYCQNTSATPAPPAATSPLPVVTWTTPANFVPWDGSMMPAGFYVFYGVGMQLPASSATMSYTCQNSGDAYSVATGSCNNAQGKPQPDSPWGQCNGGGVDATAGVTIYVMPTSASSSSQAVQLTSVSGTGNTCFAITAPQSTQVRTWSSANNNFSTNYSVRSTALAQDLEGIAIWVANSMPASPALNSPPQPPPAPVDTIGPNASIAINGAFYDPVRTVEVTGTAGGANGNTTLVGTGPTLNASGPTPCSQFDAFQVSVVGPANVNLAYCAYTGYTYIQTPDYNYLGSVQLVQ